LKQRDVVGIPEKCINHYAANKSRKRDKAVNQLGPFDLRVCIAGASAVLLHKFSPWHLQIIIQTHAQQKHNKNNNY